MQHFADSSEHLFAELERLDLLVRAQVARARGLHAADEQFRGLYISEQEVDALLQRPLGRPHWLIDPAHASAAPGAALRLRLRESIERRRQASRRQGIELRLDRLQQAFGLERFDLDVLIVCLAVELDLRYERLYAYLQDDVTRKKPGVELMLDLLTDSVDDKLGMRQRFSSCAPLMRHRLVELVDDPSQPRPPLLARGLKIDDRIAQYLLGADEIDDRIRSHVALAATDGRPDELPLGGDLERGLQGLATGTPAGARRVIVHLRGPRGAGKQSAAQAACRQAGVRLLVADLESLAIDADKALDSLLALVDREATLQGASVYWRRFDALERPDRDGAKAQFLSHLARGVGLAFVGGQSSWRPDGLWPDAAFFSVEMPRPTSAERIELWRAAMDGQACDAAAPEVATLSGKFKFTRGQIREVAATAASLARWREPRGGRIEVADLYEACRLHSNHKLASLARKITPRYRWDDIVLPAARLAQLRDVCNHVKYRERVYGDWGFDKRLALGKGLAILFAGPSGTGKTMAADIIAGELGLDLYKIDLSNVVSKYIGETEKNLSRIFTEAETSNAILFFDEADALFGKRSEVKDSHDRYANIETGYLLQRMEEYEGVVILATNFRRNMDEAFVRRLHFTVEFPFPDLQDRRRIWDGIWPDETPRDERLDLDFMARRFEITGGNIRNVALTAAFLAADDGGVVRMEHVLLATQREYQKMGKLTGDAEFGGWPGSGVTQ